MVSRSAKRARRAVTLPEGVREARAAAAAWTEALRPVLISLKATSSCWPSSSSGETLEEMYHFLGSAQRLNRACVWARFSALHLSDSLHAVQRFCQSDLGLGQVGEGSLGRLVGHTRLLIEVDSYAPRYLYRALNRPLPLGTVASQLTSQLPRVIEWLCSLPSGRTSATTPKIVDEVEVFRCNVFMLLLISLCALSDEEWTAVFGSATVSAPLAQAWVRCSSHIYGPIEDEVLLNPSLVLPNATRSKDDGGIMRPLVLAALERLEAWRTCAQEGCSRSLATGDPMFQCGRYMHDQALLRKRASAGRLHRQTRSRLLQRVGTLRMLHRRGISGELVGCPRIEGMRRSEEGWAAMCPGCMSCSMNILS
ncbi:hypothetical protein CALCODRAFT_201002 [Calocera cornea HHB12733]|uniref:Uncharacterized protein n=1 Tax=Calocera cornea HHB12733 TaxID=1353952 RepID=A0A165C4X1_9BASI|nr:hypothetical protein CALCODRAFT_201002 [Calocera cornea HHB12733]